ncbi:MAG: DEAD/DEAH box helicase [Proteobacteria bacterium]|nr:DEAD/DEAH box helicase [Pseudomonadota bacterium]
MDSLTHFILSSFEQNIRSRVTIDAVPGEYEDLPASIDPELIKSLNKQGIKHLYSHQKKAFQSISEQKDTLLVSHTASGKTLSFFLPILNDYIHAKSPFSVLLLYPTKALSRDQESTFGAMMNVVEKSGRLGTFDGDTPQDERTRIQRSSDFIITNPDMLHGGILPNHNRKWKDFLSRLRYIVIDEVHIYRGAFGSHVANVFRRLLRVCEIHGSNPTFICSSATVANPGEHAKALFDRDFHVIQKDGAPKSKRTIYFMNPSLAEFQGHTLYRKGPASISIPLLREAIKQKVRTICFCRSRQEVERLYRAVTDGFPRLKSLIKPYRGGLLPNERRALEKDLVAGNIIGIISTNALELGIDIGDLELCILSGHPGSLASFWQQSGRVGRQDKASNIVFIGKDTPIDQYLVHHSDFITKTSVEQALLNADNPYILMQHLPCMAHEHPLRESEPGFNKMIFEEAVDILKEDKTLVPYRDTLRYALQDYPAKGVNLRGMTDHNIEIYCNSEVIGEIDPIGARGELYKDAIYHHLGRKFMSLDLDLEKKLCKVEEVTVDYYTEAHWEGRIELTESEEKRELNGAQIDFGYIHYNKQPKLYKKIKERSYENIGYGPITLPPFEYDTTGFCMLVPKPWCEKMEDVDKRYVGAALYGLSYLLRHTAPILCMADVKDIDTDVSLVETDSLYWKSALYMFDSIEGGVGYAEKSFENIENCLEMCLEILTSCGCTSGCPACVPPLPPGVTNEELENLLIESNASVACSTSLLNALLTGNLNIPNVETVKSVIQGTIELTEEESERLQVKQKLGRAAKLLQKKRERIH